jgi:hypothetical protein
LADFAGGVNFAAMHFFSIDKFCGLSVPIEKEGDDDFCPKT